MVACTCILEVERVYFIIQIVVVDGWSVYVIIFIHDMSKCFRVCHSDVSFILYGSLLLCMCGDQEAEQHSKKEINTANRRSKSCLGPRALYNPSWDQHGRSEIHDTSKEC